jgi:hypothetical protein
MTDCKFITLLLDITDMPSMPSDNRSRRGILPEIFSIVKKIIDRSAGTGLKVNKGIDAALMLNQKGAGNLLENGDLLFKNIGEPPRLLSIAERRLIFTARNNNL